MVRNYTDYLKASADALEGSPIPKTFAIWSALSTVAGALGRRVSVSYTHLTLPTKRIV